MIEYSMRVEWSPEDEVYVASCTEMGGLSAHGDEPREAVHELSEALESASAVYEEEGWPLPEARTARGYSGQFRVRIPKSLHQWLVEAAEWEGVSLNTMVVAKLSEAMGSVVETRLASSQP